MSDVLVDSNVILDVLTEDPQWLEWSARRLAECADQGDLVINPLIYALGFHWLQSGRRARGCPPARLFPPRPLALPSRLWSRTKLPGISPPLILNSLKLLANSPHHSDYTTNCLGLTKTKLEF